MDFKTFRYYHKKNNTPTVNSLSGGKTSSYITVHYPADYEIFVIVCVDAHNAGKQIDKKLKQQVNDRLQKYSSHHREFVATSEDPKIIRTMFDLEQKIGREIIWLRGLGWEDMVAKKKAIPNQQKRFCTTVMKMQPIFEFLYKYVTLPVKMRIGYRYDEIERMYKAGTKYKYAYRCDYRKNSKIHRWKEIEWRINEFPLINDKIIHPHIKEYWKKQNIEFPKDSNCLNCFWKQPEQLRKNFNTSPQIMNWTKILESLNGNTFKDKYSMRQIEKLPIQKDFVFGTGAGCQAGFCTD